MMTQEAFDVLDQVFDLVAEQDVNNGGTYQWVCDYAGGKFYTQVDDQYIWLQDGI